MRITCARSFPFPFEMGLPYLVISYRSHLHDLMVSFLHDFFTKSHGNYSSWILISPFIISCVLLGKTPPFIANCIIRTVFARVTLTILHCKIYQSSPNRWRSITSTSWSPTRASAKQRWRSGWRTTTTHAAAFWGNSWSYTVRAHPGYRPALSI